MEERSIPPQALRWLRSEIDFDAIDPAAVDDDEALFYLVVGASFIESASDLYTSNLVDYYREDAALTGWLADAWQWQELQHGAALRDYVLHAWPDFGWDAAYADFLADYSQLCVADNFKPSPALELAARCVVETSTASLYRMIQAATREPVLKLLAGQIYGDEVHHYGMFHRFQRRYRRAERMTRRKLLWALARRVRETHTEDAYLAFKHIWRHRHPGRDFHDDRYREIHLPVAALARRHWPYQLTANMLVAPVELPALLQPLARRALTGLLRLRLFH